MAAVASTFRFTSPDEIHKLILGYCWQHALWHHDLTDDTAKPFRPCALKMENTCTLKHKEKMQYMAMAMLGRRVESNKKKAKWKERGGRWRDGGGRGTDGGRGGAGGRSGGPPKGPVPGSSRADKLQKNIVDAIHKDE